MEGKTVKILHTADLHLDSPFEALTAEKAMTRRAEQRMLLNRIAGMANSEKADIVLLCGDILDSDSPFFETGEELCACLRKIDAPVFISPGNHDFYCEAGPYLRIDMPENVHVFKSPEVECVELPELGVRVYGAAFTDRVCGSLLAGFHAERTPGVINIMCIHGEVGNDSSRYNPITPEQIKESGIDYIALGHIHKASGLQREGNTFWSQAGCPEGRGFDETGDRSLNMIEISATGCRLRELKVSARKYEQISVDVSEADPYIAIQMALPDETIRDIYRITLTGETDRQIKLPQLKSSLESFFFSLQMVDKTTVRRDIWDFAEENTLRGIFLTKLKKAYENSGSEEEKQKIDMAANWGIAALDNMEEPYSYED